MSKLIYKTYLYLAIGFALLSCKQPVKSLKSSLPANQTAYKNKTLNPPIGQSSSTSAQVNTGRTGAETTNQKELNSPTLTSTGCGPNGCSIEYNNPSSGMIMYDQNSSWLPNASTNHGSISTSGTDINTFNPKTFQYDGFNFTVQSLGTIEMNGIKVLVNPVASNHSLDSNTACDDKVIKLNPVQTDSAENNSLVETCGINIDLSIHKRLDSQQNVMYFGSKQIYSLDLASEQELLARFDIISVTQ